MTDALHRLKAKIEWASAITIKLCVAYYAGQMRHQSPKSTQRCAETYETKVNNQRQNFCVLHKGGINTTSSPKLPSQECDATDVSLRDAQDPTSTVKHMGQSSADDFWLSAPMPMSVTAPNTETRTSESDTNPRQIQIPDLCVTSIDREGCLAANLVLKENKN